MDLNFWSWLIFLVQFLEGSCSSKVFGHSVDEASGVRIQVWEWARGDVWWSNQMLQGEGAYQIVYVVPRFDYPCLVSSCFPMKSLYLMLAERLCNKFTLSNQSKGNTHVFDWNPNKYSSFLSLTSVSKDCTHSSEYQMIPHKPEIYELLLVLITRYFWSWIGLIRVEPNS